MSRVFKMYYAASVDCSIDHGKYMLDIFKDIFKKYPEIEVFGAGIGESPILSLDSSIMLKKAIVAYDLRKLRECDILLVVTDLKTYCAGTHMELEYARSLGMLTIVLSFDKDPVKNIFMETLADLIIYSTEDLERILSELVGR